MRVWVLFVLIFLVGPISTPLRAQEGAAEVEPGEGPIFGTGWGMTLALDGTGFYNDVIRLALEDVTPEKLYQPLPYKRAKVEFAKDTASCLYPSNIEHLARGGEINLDNDFIQTVPVIWVESHLFSRPGTPPLTSLSALEGKKVAYPNGSALPTVLGEFGAQFMPTTDENTKARMLIAGRVHYMSGSLPDNIFVFKALGHPLPPYNPDLALIRTGVSVVCHDTPANRTFVQAFDARMATLMRDGGMEALYAVEGVDLRFLPGYE
ncbi:MAG: hypothetical protein HWE25_02995 [Alphaproteobacteria bacterium]|nr:hypothetical protein [Alphaproteobacteria bacterium]